MTSFTSDIVPIWFSLIKIELAIFSLTPLDNLSKFVTNKSSPTNWILLPIKFVNIFHPLQSSSERPSSIE